MHLVQKQTPPPRLIHSLEPEPGEPETAGNESQFALRGAGLLSGNSRWIFIGIAGGAVAISLAGYLFSHRSPDSPPRKLLSVITHTVSSSPNSTATPEPVVVQIPPDAIRVTAISLGHPRLAVLNGTSVAEGDSVQVRTPGSGVVVKLRVASIADGRVDLRNGKQLICARLSPANHHQAAR